MLAWSLQGLLRSHKDVGHVAFYVVMATAWLAMSVEYVRRAMRKQPLMSA